MSGQAGAKRCGSRGVANGAEAQSGLWRDIRRLRDVAIEMADSSAGHDCERRPTRMDRIPNDKPKTACNERCAGTNTSRKQGKSATVSGHAKGSRSACRLCTLPLDAKCAGSHFLEAGAANPTWTLACEWRAAHCSGPFSKANRSRRCVGGSGRSPNTSRPSLVSEALLTFVRYCWTLVFIPPDRRLHRASCPDPGSGGDSRC